MQNKNQMPLCYCASHCLEIMILFFKWYSEVTVVKPRFKFGISLVDDEKAREKVGLYPQLDAVTDGRIDKLTGLEILTGHVLSDLREMLWLLSQIKHLIPKNGFTPDTGRFTRASIKRCNFTRGSGSYFMEIRTLSTHLALLTACEHRSIPADPGTRSHTKWHLKKLFS